MSRRDDRRYDDDRRDDRRDDERRDYRRDDERRDNRRDGRDDDRRDYRHRDDDRRRDSDRRDDRTSRDFRSRTNVDDHSEREWRRPEGIAQKLENSTRRLEEVTRQRSERMAAANSNTNSSEHLNNNASNVEKKMPISLEELLEKKAEEQRTLNKVCYLANILLLFSYLEFSISLFFFPRKNVKRLQWKNESARLKKRRLKSKMKGQKEKHSFLMVLMVLIIHLLLSPLII